MKIIYLAPENLSIEKSIPLNRAPRIRTHFMLKALKKVCTVYCICGSIDERKKSYKKFYKFENLENYVGLYMESANWPLRIADYKFLMYCKKKITLSIFYRDCFWRTKKYKSGLKLNEIQSLIRFYFEFILFKKFFNIFYVPTETFGKFCQLDSFQLLPPGGIITEKVAKRYDGGVFRILFAGNAKKGYKILYNIVDKLNNDGYNVELHIISTDKFETSSDKIFVHNTNYENSLRIFKMCHIGIIPHLKNEYFDTSFPVKIMNYLSFGLPIVSTNTFEVEKYLRENNIGEAVNYNEQSFLFAICSLINNKERYELYSRNAITLVKERENWNKRSMSIIENLKKKSNKVKA